MTTQLSPQVSLTENDDGIVLLDEQHGNYWQLNCTAATILNALLEGHTAADAARMLAAEHLVTGDRADQDVSQFIESLRAARLVEES